MGGLVVLQFYQNEFQCQRNSLMFQGGPEGRILIAAGTHEDLACQVRYLKVENQANSPAESTFEPSASRLLKFGDSSERPFTTRAMIVAPSTFLRWIREATESV